MSKARLRGACLGKEEHLRLRKRKKEYLKKKVPDHNITASKAISRASMQSGTGARLKRIIIFLSMGGLSMGVIRRRKKGNQCLRPSTRGYEGRDEEG